MFAAIVTRRCSHVKGPAFPPPALPCSPLATASTLELGAREVRETVPCVMQELTHKHREEIFSGDVLTATDPRSILRNMGEGSASGLLGMVRVM